MSKYGWRDGEIVSKNLTVDNDLTIEGDMSFGDASTDTLTVEGEARFNARTRCLNRPLSEDGYALEVKTDYDAATGVGQGAFQCSTRVYPAADTSAVYARGGYFQCQLHADDTMTGGSMTGLYCQVHANDTAILNGTTVLSALATDIADGGVYTAVTSVTSLLVDSHLSQTVSSGTFSMITVENNGTTTADNLILVDGGDNISNFATLTNVDGMAMVANGSVLNDISSTANDGYIKVVVEGEDKYIALYDLKA